MALIAGVFLGNPFRNRLHAFEALGGIEVRALLAGMEFESALWALAGRVGEHGQEGAALGAARYFVRTRHIDRAGAEGVFARRAVEGRALLFLAGILISMLPVFPI